MGWLNGDRSFEAAMQIGKVADYFAKANVIASVDLIHHGRWISCHPGNADVFCSECGTLGTHAARYCPNCWSRMDQKE